MGRDPPDYLILREKFKKVKKDSLDSDVKEAYRAAYNRYYYRKNKESLKTKSNDYYYNNLNKIKERFQNYYRANKDLIKQTSKDYYKDNRRIILKEAKAKRDKIKQNNEAYKMRVNK